MDKKTYYVTVAEEEPAAEEKTFEFEFEIDATEEEIGMLQELFGSGEPLPEKGTVSKVGNLEMKEIYRMLHQLGTPETKAQIEQMDVL